jgi:hypothetical protein
VDRQRRRRRAGLTTYDSCGLMQSRSHQHRRKGGHCPPLQCRMGTNGCCHMRSVLLTPLACLPFSSPPCCRAVASCPPLAPWPGRPLGPLRQLQAPQHPRQRRPPPRRRPQQGPGLGWQSMGALRSRRLRLRSAVVGSASVVASLNGNNRVCCILLLGQRGKPR